LRSAPPSETSAWRQLDGQQGLFPNAAGERKGFTPIVLRESLGLHKYLYGCTVFLIRFADRAVW
jgi:hypothetical protein